MNYRHAFHAGNFADVFKHVLLMRLLDMLTAKPGPLRYIDTHAGAGRYDLRGAEAGRTGEFADGVQRAAAGTNPPAFLQPYLDLLRGLNGGADALRSYPGSPLIAATLLRDIDRAVLCECQADEARRLAALFAHDKRIQAFQRDGYAALAALLPPPERRGLVLIDPPFEAQEAEFRAIETALDSAFARWPTGVYAIWYPIKQRRALAPFHRWFAARGVKKTLAAELLVQADDSPLRLNGCGMVVVNAPWRFDDWLRQILPELTRLLARDARASQQVVWLAAE